MPKPKPKNKPQPKRKPRKTGRPKIQLEQAVFEGLCRIQCTLTEISGVLGASVDTIERWCKQTYSTTFADIFRQKAAAGKMSLRRTQYRIAESGNVTMLIWLGKQYLGQADKQDLAVDITMQADKEKQLDERVMFAIEGFKKAGLPGKVERRDVLELFAKMPESLGDLLPLVEAELKEKP